METIVNLGDRVKDKITKYKGIVTSITTYLYGCRRVGVKTETLKDGLPKDSHVFDEPQLSIEKRNVIKVPPVLAGGAVVTGGPRPVNSRRSVPSAKS